MAKRHKLHLSDEQLQELRHLRDTERTRVFTRTLRRRLIEHIVPAGLSPKSIGSPKAVC